MPQWVAAILKFLPLMIGEQWVALLPAVFPS